MRLEKLILDNLVNNEEYGRKVIAFIKPEYFQDFNERVIFNIIDGYVTQYNKFPSKTALKLEISNRKDINDDQFKECVELCDELAGEKDAVTSFDWLLDNTEQFCQDRAIHNAIFEAIKIMDNKADGIGKGSIPQLLADALGVSFDTNIGHDFFENADDRYEFYHRKEEKIPFDLEYLNKITKGGLSRKTLNVLLASTGVGKSLMMCHMAAANLSAGSNVLYITLELSEERVAERIDANLMGVTMDELRELPKETFDKKITKLREKTIGKLVIKEYPTSSAGSANFRHLLNELKLKRNFVPDIIYIDYLNICSSSRLKNNGNVNSYTYIKAIAEELRSLAVEFNVPVVSASQTNRAGTYNTDVDLTNTSESMGLPHTCDLMLAMVSSEELAALNQFLIIQLKNRYGDLGYFNKFVIGVDKSRMRCYNVEQAAQNDIIDSSSSTGRVQTDTGSKFSKDKFEGFK